MNVYRALVGLLSLVVLHFAVWGVNAHKALVELLALVLDAWYR